MNDNDNSQQLANETYDLTFERGAVDHFGFRDFVWQGTNTVAEFEIIGEVEAIFSQENAVCSFLCSGIQPFDNIRSSKP